MGGRKSRCRRSHWMDCGCQRAGPDTAGSCRRCCVGSSGRQRRCSGLRGQHMDEWHAKHVRDWAGRLQYEKQELITWVRDGRREMHETDRLPPGLEIPEDAERWTHWPESGQRLERPVLNPRFNDGSQGFAVYQGRLHRQEWALVIVLGRAAVLHESEVDSRWIPLQGFSANGGSITGRLWFIR